MFFLNANTSNFLRNFKWKCTVKKFSPDYVFVIPVYNLLLSFYIIYCLCIIILLLIMKVWIALALRLAHQTESLGVLHTSQSCLLNTHSEAAVTPRTALSSGSRHPKSGVHTHASLSERGV